jgi:hypothetical protein
VFLASDVGASTPEQSAFRLQLKVSLYYGRSLPILLSSSYHGICIMARLLSRSHSSTCDPTFNATSTSSLTQPPLQNCLLQFLEKSKLVLEKYRLLTAVPSLDPLLPSSTGATRIPSSNDSPRLQATNSPDTGGRGEGTPVNGAGDLSSPNKKVIEKYYSGNESAEAVNRRQLSGGGGGVGSGTPPLPDPNSMPPPPPQLTQGVSSNAANSSASELVWLTEMEKGYDALVDAIYPFITDVAVVSMNRTIIRSFSTFGDLNL